MLLILKVCFFSCIFLLPLTSFALTFSEAKHLLGRTGFAPSFQEINRYLPLNKSQAIETRLQELNTQPNIPLNDDLTVPYSINLDFKRASKKEKMAFNKQQRQRMKALQEWWLREMLTTSSPMTENLTLFWHNHFVTSARKVRRPELIAIQNLTLREHSSGNFKAFLLAILQDAAMLVYLDNHRNLKNKPNENLARELLELFTLGEGNYSEQDIKNVARILSGYGIFRKTGEVRFNQKQHDHGEKILFGKKGNFYLSQLVELILKKPATTEFITKKLWKHYISNPIPRETLKKLAQDFQQTYELKPLIKSILQQPEFWSTANRATQIKSPVQLIVGLNRQFEVVPKNIKPHINALAQMNQNIFYPPNVKGWQTGEAWIDTQTLILRQNYLNSQTRGMNLISIIKAGNNKNWPELLVEKPSKVIEKENMQFKIAASQDFDEIREALNKLLLMPHYQLH